jgi:hypothetical protein
VTPLPQIAATRYVLPLREGGSLPGLLEADDDGIYVVKWTGAGQGRLALVAEVIGIGLARAPFEPPAPPALAADVVWLDGWLMNVDRTARNPNLLSWHRQMWLIDFGAALYPQHATKDLPGQALRPFPALRDHVLADTAESLHAAHQRLAAPALAAIEQAVAMVPESWFVTHPREAYSEFLRARLRAAPWLEEAMAETGSGPA